jgi:hypothetical protein
MIPFKGKGTINCTDHIKETIKVNRDKINKGILIQIIYSYTTLYFNI